MGRAAEILRIFMLEPHVCGMMCFALGVSSPLATFYDGAAEMA